MSTSSWEIYATAGMPWDAVWSGTVEYNSNQPSTRTNARNWVALTGFFSLFLQSGTDQFKGCLHYKPVALYWAIQRSWFTRVNALCNLSRKKSRVVAAHFRANFWVGVASRCVEVEVEPRIAKQCKWQYCCSCKNYRGKGMEGGKKCLCFVFLADQKIASS